MSPADYGLDPAEYFVDSDGRSAPLIVRNDTGEPAYVVLDGALSPYVPRAAVQTRRGGGSTFAASGGGLSLTIAVGPPPEG